MVVKFLLRIFYVYFVISIFPVFFATGFKNPFQRPLGRFFLPSRDLRCCSVVPGELLEQQFRCALFQKYFCRKYLIITRKKPINDRTLRRLLQLIYGVAALWGDR